MKPYGVILTAPNFRAPARPSLTGASSGSTRTGAMAGITSGALASFGAAACPAPGVARLAYCVGPDSVSTSECRVSASAALFSSAASESLTTPLAFSSSSNCCMPAEPDMLRRLLASAVVRIPFFTRRSTKVGLITAAAPTLAPLFVVAALVAALVGSAVVVALESAAPNATWNKRHAIASRHTTDDRKQSRIFASKQVGEIQYQPGKPGVIGIPDR